MSGVVRSVMVRMGLDNSEVIRKNAESARSFGTLEATASKAQRTSSINASRANDMVGRTARNVFIAGAAGLGVLEAANYKFDRQMSAVDAATHTTAANMDLLRNSAIELGAQTVFSSTEAAQGITELAKAGVATKDIIGGGLKGALSLAAAGSLDVGQSAEYMATALTQFGLKGTQASHVADLLAAGAGKAQGEVSDMALALSYAGVPAAQLGISIEETAGSIALLAHNGIIGDRAGTGLRGVLSSLTSPSVQAGKAMKKYNIELFDAQGNFKGLANVAQQLHERLGGLTQQERANVLGRIFGNQQLGVANVLYKEGAKGVQAWTRNVNDSGYAADTAKRKLNNLSGDVEYLKGDLEALFIRRGGGFQGGLRDIVQGVDRMVTRFSKLPASVQSGIVKVIALGTATAGVIYIVSKLVKAYEGIRGLTSGLSLAKGAAAGGLAGAATRGVVPVFVTNEGFGGGGIAGAAKGGGAGAAEGAAVGAAATRTGTAKMVLSKVAITAGSVLLAGQLAQGIAGILDAALPETKKDKSDPLFKDFHQEATGAFSDVTGRNSLGRSLNNVSDLKGGGGLNGYGTRSSQQLGKLFTFGQWGAGLDDDTKRVAKLDTALEKVTNGNHQRGQDEFNKILQQTGLKVEDVNRALPKTAQALAHVTTAGDRVAANDWWNKVSGGSIKASEQAARFGKTLRTIPKEIRAYVSTPGAVHSAAEMTRIARIYHLTPKQILTVMRLQGYSEVTAQITAAGRRFRTLPKQVRTALRAETVKSQADVIRLQRQYHLTPGQVRTVMQVSGVDRAMAQLRQLRSEIASIRSKSVTINVNKVTHGGGGGTTYNTPAQADGGPVVAQPGQRRGPRDDDVLTALSHREWVQPVAAVDYYGEGFMRAVQTRQYPRVPAFADGGQVGVAQARNWGTRGSSVAGGLAGIRVTGTLDTPWGPAQIRGLVEDVVAESDDMAGMRARAAR